MKRVILGLVLLLTAILPASAHAHGGTQHVTADAIITLYQEPLSPLKGEEVTAEFMLSDKNGNRLQDLPLTLTLINTHFGDASKDYEVLKKELITNKNGMVSLTYRFDQADYYDFELEFTLNNNQQDAGFLVQVREAKSREGWAFVVAAALLGGGAGWLLVRARSSAKFPPQSRPRSPNKAHTSR